MRWVLVLTLSSGCIVFHRDTNAPGRIDPTTPPTDLTSRAPERPADPGERLFIFGVGPHLGLGGDTNLDSALAFGATFSFALATRPSSHDRDDHFELATARGYGIDVGWDVLAGSFEDDDPHVGRLFAELHRRFFVAAPSRVAVGWGVNPATGATGPQASLVLAGGNYVRVAYDIAGPATFLFGFDLELPMVWVWSR